MYGTEHYEDLEAEKTKKSVKIFERDSLYKSLEAHINIVYFTQYSIALGFVFLIWVFDEVRKYMMEHPAFLIISCASCILCIVAVRFFFITIRDFPLSLLSLILFSLSKIYLLGFIFCICYYHLYVYSLALLCGDFFLISIITLSKFSNMYLIIGVILLLKVALSFILTIFFSILESFLICLITGLISIVYQFTIYAINRKQKFGQKDFLVSSFYLYAFWLIPIAPDD
ncbi:transmembrane protein, putative (macronuclear) [Tetrahymena thermophila SB210]|uniref:Transmembrane protein, putative n=1 Tax=Tetrahymena thermophila (strain SB210) TaxID=312017 RepID=Q233G6_TETTS|nr:transmembrane protein, putative [Tetrahymena thermophila SB210]EAR91614.2 transmembrane protein, putative [Tetrahymena thermophila SB210]|eukprot:XP_001011859.2 transmembrane protein, putative [Tetrahymena thermophila SB210]